MGKNSGLRADQIDYKRAYKRHYRAYMSLDGQSDAVILRQLSLIYCVECGLKYLVMYHKRINRVSDAQEHLKNILTSHHIEILLGELGQSGGYKFPPFRTAYGDTVYLHTYHQLVRYALSYPHEARAIIQRYDEQLAKIADWIQGRI